MADPSGNRHQILTGLRNDDQDDNRWENGEDHIRISFSEDVYHQAPLLLIGKNMFVPSRRPRSHLQSNDSCSFAGFTFLLFFPEVLPVV